MPVNPRTLDAKLSEFERAAVAYHTAPKIGPKAVSLCQQEYERQRRSLRNYVMRYADDRQ